MLTAILDPRQMQRVGSFSRISLPNVSHSRVVLDRACPKISSMDISVWMSMCSEECHTTQQFGTDDTESFRNVRPSMDYG